MNGNLPRAAVVRSALRMTTERLAAEVASPQLTAPDWNDYEWRTAIAVAVMHGISGLLANRLRWQGPPAWQGFLTEQAEHARRREQCIRTLLDELDRRAREAGLPLLALKGSSLLRLGLYAPGERPMADVDLLARPGPDAEAADRMILAAGYELGAAKPRHTAYEPLGRRAECEFGEHEGNPVQIELHESISEPLPVHPVDITAGLLAPNAAPGLNAYASVAGLMRHLLLHTAGNLRNRNVRLIQLHDIAVLAARLDAGDWDEALAAAWWAVPPLQLVQRLFPGRLPRAAMEALARNSAGCPPWLRYASNRQQLADLSLSRLNIPVLPGLAWSRGPGEMLALAWQRLHRGRSAQAALLQEVRRHHALAGATWAYQPPWRKALAFVLGAPPRLQTLYSLHGALAYRPSSSA